MRFILVLALFLLVAAAVDAQNHRPNHRGERDYAGDIGEFFGGKIYRSLNAPKRPRTLLQRRQHELKIAARKQRARKLFNYLARQLEKQNKYGQANGQVLLNKLFKRLSAHKRRRAARKFNPAVQRRKALIRRQAKRGFIGALFGAANERAKRIKQHGPHQRQNAALHKAHRGIHHPKQRASHQAHGHGQKHHRLRDDEYAFLRHLLSSQ